MADTTRQEVRTQWRSRPLATGGILGLIFMSALALSIAPLYMPESYSIIEHAVSASAGQGVDHAWIARTGFLLLTVAALWLGSVRAEAWGAFGRFVFRVYAAALVAATVFGQRPWLDEPFDLIEDVLHQIAATVVAVAFTLGVLVFMVRRDSARPWARAFDLLTIAAAVVLPLIMFNVTPIHGLAQRALFVVGYSWFGVETIRAARSQPGMSAAPRREAGPIAH